MTCRRTRSSRTWSRRHAGRSRSKWCRPSAAPAPRGPSARLGSRAIGARVAIVGAGPSGLAALRALREAGLDAVAFEKGGRIGGVWTREDRSTAAYRTLHLITSRERTEYGELPMPPDTPDYPPRDAVGSYLEDYAERFGLLEHVRLGTEVRRASRADGGGWDVDGEHFDRLVV